MKHLKTFEEQTQKISIEDFDNFLDSIKNLSVTDIEKAIQMLREFSDKYPYIKTEEPYKEKYWKIVSIIHSNPKWHEKVKSNLYNN